MRKMLYLFFFVSCILGSLKTHAQSWQWAMGSSDSTLEGYAITTDKSGNVFVAGFAAFEETVKLDTIILPGTLTYSGYNYGSKSVIAKYDNSGMLLWAKNVNIGESQPCSIKADTAGNVIMLGIFDVPQIQIDTFNLYRSTDDTSQYFIVKFDPAGNVLWAKTSFDASSVYGSINGLHFWLADFVYNWGAVTTDVSGNIFITGNFNNATTSVGSYRLTNVDTSGTTDDIFVAKYDPSGNILWASSIGGTSNDDATGITVTSAGNMYITGAFASPVILIDTSAIINSYSVGPFGVERALIAEFNSSGSPVWGEAAGGMRGAYCIGITSDTSNNVYVTGGFEDSSISFGDSSIDRIYPSTAKYPAQYIVKLSSANTVVWSNTIGDTLGSAGAAYSIAYAIAISPTAVWICGTWCGVDSLNINGNFLHAPANSPDPVFFAGYDINTGNVIGYEALQSGGDDLAGIACDECGNVFICADYSNYNLVVGQDTLLVSGYYVPIRHDDSEFFSFESLYTAKYGSNCINAGIGNLTIPISSLTLYPNPAVTELTITATSPIQSVCICNLLGQQVMTYSLPASPPSFGGVGGGQIDISSLPAGVYVVKVTDDLGAQVVRKLVKE